LEVNCREYVGRMGQIDPEWMVMGYKMGVVGIIVSLII
jgi:hypothetical protein